MSAPSLQTTSEQLDTLWAWRVATYSKTVDQNPWIPDRAKPRNNPKQRQFLLLTDVREVFYGGAAGGGKTYASLMAAAQFVDVPGYSALLLRENFSDLLQPMAWVAISKDWWKNKAHWSASEHRWTFPSGATITFGYLERDDSVYQYDSAAYQFIGIDELTQHTEWRYRFMFGRIRRPLAGPLAGVPLRMRATSNPGNKGHDWVKQRFIDPATREPEAAFVPAMLDDNKGNLDVEEYREKSLSKLDPITRAQREKGDWDAIEDGRFKRAWLKYYRRYGSAFNLSPMISPNTPGYRHEAHRCLNDFGSPDRPRLESRFLTVDAAGTIKTTSGHDPDYTVISAWGYGDGQLLWLGCVAVRREVPEIPKLVAVEYRLHRATKVYFRPSGMEKAVPQLCRRHREPVMNVVELPTKGDKLNAAADFLNMAEAGRVWLPHPGAATPHTGPFPLEDVRANLLRFTGDGSGHDDIWDTAGIAGTVAESGGLSSGSVPRVIQTV